MHITLFGTGQFGRALAALAAKNGHTITTWSYRQGTPIASLPEADLYISTLNASGLEQVGTLIRDKAKGKPVISTTKAFVHADSLKQIFPSQILGDSTLVLSGPNLASEMLLGLPTGATIAGDRFHFELVQDALGTSEFMLEYAEERRSVELMGIVKNIIAIGIGMIDGFGLGENLKGIFIAKICKDTRDFAQDSLGIDFDITALYAGIGDLFTTCSSTESRNHGFGLYLARTKSIKTATEFMNTSIEGLWSIDVLKPLLPQKYRFLSRFIELFHDDGVGANREEFMKVFIG